MSGYLMYGYAHHHGWPALRKFSTPVEIYVTTASSFSRIIITFWYRSPQCMHYSSSAILLYRHCSRFIIHTHVIIFRMYTYYIHCYKCVCRLRVYYNLIYIFNVFIARCVEGEIIITIMTADYCAWRGSLSKYKLTLLNRVFSAFW